MGAGPKGLRVKTGMIFTTSCPCPMFFFHPNFFVEIGNIYWQRIVEFGNICWQRKYGSPPFVALCLFPQDSYFCWIWNRTLAAGMAFIFTTSSPCTTMSFSVVFFSIGLVDRYLQPRTLWAGGWRGQAGVGDIACKCCWERETTPCCPCTRDNCWNR